MVRAHLKKNANLDIMCGYKNDQTLTSSGWMLSTATTSKENNLKNRFRDGKCHIA